jgi:hypothetical protein
VFLRIFLLDLCWARHLQMELMMPNVWKYSKAYELCLERLPMRWSVFYLMSSLPSFRQRRRSYIILDCKIYRTYSCFILARLEQNVMI